MLLRGPSLCLSVCHNRWMEWDAIWQGHSCDHKYCIRRPWSPTGRGDLGVGIVFLGLEIFDQKCFILWMLICKLPLIFIVAPLKSRVIVNGQLGVGDSKYMVVSYPKPTSHMTVHAQWAFWPLEWAEHYNGGEHYREQRRLIFGAWLDFGKFHTWYAASSRQIPQGWKIIFSKGLTWPSKNWHTLKNISKSSKARELKFGTQLYMGISHKSGM